MKLPKNLVLLLIAGLLLAGAWAYSGPFKAWQEKRQEPKNPLSTLVVKDLKTIIVNQDKQKTKLVKSNGQWQVDEGKKVKFPATKSLMELIETTLASSTESKLELVSTNKARQNDFQVAGKEAINVSFETADKNFEMSIGKVTSDYQGSYLAFAGDTKTYKLATQNMRYLLERTEWRDLAIFDQGQKSTTKLRLQYPNKQLLLEKKGQLWQAGKSQYQGEDVDKLTQIMAQLKAAKIPVQDFKDSGLDKPTLIIEVSGDGFDNTLMIGKSTKDKLYYAKTANLDNLYLISQADHDSLIALPRIKK